MNEGTKTGIFWGVAVAMLVLAMVVAWPKTYQDTGKIVPGTLLFEQFNDPLAAASMRIVTFDDEQGQLAVFEVAKDADTNLWTIPSRNGYPADALEQMRNAANALVGVKILDIQTSNAEDHDDLGVVEPKLKELQIGDVGVGRLVTFRDGSDTTLASLIIGDALKDDPEKRFVRIPGQDPVYVVKLDDSALTTKFRDWIEDDLLQLSSIDIAEIEMKDYTAALNVGNQVAVTRNYAANFGLDGSQWTLNRLVEFDPKDPLADPVPVNVDDNLELSKSKLDGIKNALDDLRIVDVVRKPDGMSANLRANQDLLSDENAVASLAQRGIYPVPSATTGALEILAANGELSVTLIDGVKYVMRFGNIAGVTDRDDTESADQGVSTGVNRYLLVTTMLDESKFPPPDLKPVPQTLEDLDAILNPQPAADDSKIQPSEQDSETASGDAPAENADQESESAESPQDDSDQNEDEVPPVQQLTQEELLERLEAEQEKITKENTRKLDERKDRMEAARRRVRDLNTRFADWYYVIPEDTYSKLRIKRDELFVQPEQQVPPAEEPSDASAADEAASQP